MARLENIDLKQKALNSTEEVKAANTSFNKAYQWGGVPSTPWRLRPSLLTNGAGCGRPLGGCVPCYSPIGRGAVDPLEVASLVTHQWGGVPSTPWRLRPSLLTNGAGCRLLLGE